MSPAGASPKLVSRVLHPLPPTPAAQQEPKGPAFCPDTRRSEPGGLHRGPAPPGPLAEFSSHSWQPSLSTAGASAWHGAKRRRGCRTCSSARLRCSSQGGSAQPSSGGLALFPRITAPEGSWMWASERKTLSWSHRGDIQGHLAQPSAHQSTPHCWVCLRTPSEGEGSISTAKLFFPVCDLNFHPVLFGPLMLVLPSSIRERQSSPTALRQPLSPSFCSISIGLQKPLRNPEGLA